MKVSVVIFPGSNCDRDVKWAFELCCNADAEMIWHAEKSLPSDTDIVVLPGGFSYGDYLRCGAMAAKSPIMKSVAEFAQRGGLVIGICNGFHILTEAKLLPGALLPNESTKFICRSCQIKIERNDTPFTQLYEKNEIVNFPIAHHDGLFYLDDDSLTKLEESCCVVFRYADNPNGSLKAIAGITNKEGNVLGLMPHPERVVHPLLGGEGGVRFFKGLSKWVKEMR
ncbi:MAG: phosphoribosylformylglycinamidine synthase subunit PurQ [Acetomicrobium sp.]|nr:phosphoribosylformylglycinamidine synthase subunit PurQ [Acetomicrobium sp.]